MRLLSEPGRIVGGEILYRGSNGEILDIAQASRARMRHIRGSEIAMIFQEPMSSLNPLMRIGDQIAEMIRLHEPLNAADTRSRVVDLLVEVEMPAASKRIDDFPHQMSGGMRQRVMIAMALACRPRLLIADEPTTALDVTIQAQIIDLLKRLQKSMGMAILFVTHNLGVVAEIADEIVVMYAGQVMERGPIASVFSCQTHPYTRALLGATPSSVSHAESSVVRQRMQAIPGTIPSITDEQVGCLFAPRCSYALDDCRTRRPDLVPSWSGQSRCLRHEELAP